MTTTSTIAAGQDENRIVHDEQIERLLNVYDRAITNAVESKFSMPEYAELEHVRHLMRQGIEQTWDAAHACQQQHAPAPVVQGEPGDPRVEYIAGLRQLAHLLEQHPELELPYSGTDKDPLCVIPYGSDRQRAQLSAWAKALPGRKDKQPRDTYFDLTGAVRGLTIKVICNRDAVCEKVVLRTETVTETVPDPEYVAAAPLIERETEREIVKWVCTPSILADERSDKFAEVAP